MALQNGVQRVHLAHLPPTTLMTGNTTQVVLDAVDVLTGRGGDQTAAIRARFGRMSTSIIGFAAGCGVAALIYAWAGFWCLCVPVAVGAVTAIIKTERPP